MTYHRSAGLIFGSVMAVIWSLVGYAETRSKEELEKEYRAASFRAVARDAFPVLFNPPMGTVADGDRFLRPSEWVIGIALNGQPKAYPITVMGFHELINDTVGGVPIAVCWWPLCQTAVVHSRVIELNGRKTVLEFGHEGVLYRQSFVMYDKETDSKWNHSTGLAMVGKLAGKQLQILPSWVVRWEKWKSMHPKTLVLAREGRGGFMGTYVANRHFSEFGLSVGQGPQAKLYPYDLLLKEEIVNDFVPPHPVVVVIDPTHKEAMAFSRKVGNETVTFKAVKGKQPASQLMRDQETGTLWDRFSGKAIEGRLKGQSIMPIIAVPWLKERWRQIYNSGIVYQGSS